MNLRHLEVFCTVVQCESFSGAAEQLFMTQPAVSMQVQAVERHFGVQLLERRSRRVVLTEAGRAVHEWARQVLTSEVETRKTVDEFVRAETGRIVLGTTMALGSHVLPQIINRFKKDHPGAEIVVRLADRPSLTDELLAGTIDVGVHIAGEVPSGLDVETVGNERMVLVSAPTHHLAGRTDVSAEELAEEWFVVPPRGYGYRSVIDRVLADQGLPNFRVLMEVGVIESIKCFIEEGSGIGIMLQSAATGELQRGLLAEIAAPGAPMNVDLVLVRRPHRDGSPLLESFVELLRQGLREHSGSGPLASGLDPVGSAPASITAAR
jgi:DNA-binding transcriptional LysR family regulator